MRLGGIAGAAIEILADIAARHRPASAALRDWGLSHRFAGSADRAAIGNLVYDALRQQLSLAWRMDSDLPEPLVVATLLGPWSFPFSELEAIFAGDRFAPQIDLQSMFQTWRSNSLDTAPDYVRADIPQWASESFAQGLGPDWIDQGRLLAQRPPLDLRVNRIKATREKVLKKLAGKGAQPCERAPDGIRIPPGTRSARLPNIQASAEYNKGWFEIQDEGSQLSALLAMAAPGEQILDYCAGAGGKTLALSAFMENRGQIHAHDADLVRLAPIHERLRRAGTRNVQVYSPDQDLAALENKMDCVLVDAPCTGSGTWRRRPDSKWRVDATALGARCAQQAAILDQASRFVGPAGRLIYITCSMFSSENQDQIKGFLARNPKFCAKSWPIELLERHKLLSTPEAATMLLSPLVTQTDGFFVAQMAHKGQ